MNKLLLIITFFLLLSITKALNSPVPLADRTTSPTLKVKIWDTTTITGFITNTNALTNSQKEKIDSLIALFKEYPDIIFRIDGHSDNSGTFTECEERAAA
jgi:outer membrane protein OmpA-like peptidoglycan-associated protein